MTLGPGSSPDPNIYYRTAKDRLYYRGVNTELTVDAGQYTGVTQGQTLTYTLTVTNPSNARLSDVPVRIILPDQVTLVSAEGMTLEGNVLTWTGKVNALSTVTLTWSVQVDALAGSHIVTEGYLAGILLNTLTNTVSGYTDTQLKAVTTKAEKRVGSSFADPLALAQQAYGSSVLSNHTAKTVLSTLIDKTNDTLHTGTGLSNLVVPNLYGGLDIKDGFITDGNRTRLVTESYLAPGDVIVAEYDNIYEVFVYLGNGKLAKVSSTDGIGTLVTSTGEAYSGTNIFATFIAYDRYVILRPSLG